MNSVLTVAQIEVILENKGGFMPDEAVMWFRECDGKVGPALTAPDKGGPERKAEPVAYRWRFKVGGEWGKWTMFDPSELDAFLDLQTHNIKRCHTEYEALYALPPSHALAEFAAWALQEGPWEGGDLDGGSIQDKAESLGLIVKVPYDPEVHGESDYCEPGDDWFTLAPAVKAARSVAENDPVLTEGYRLVDAQLWQRLEDIAADCERDVHNLRPRGSPDIERLIDARRQRAFLDMRPIIQCAAKPAPPATPKDTER